MARHNHLDAESARAAEALGKIGSVAENIPLIGQAQLERASVAIIKLLPATTETLSPSQLAATGWCITALMRLRAPQAVVPLTRLLQSSEREICAQAANALSRLRQPIAEAVPALIAALGDNINQDLRANAARALGVSNDPRAVAPLINALNDKSVEVEISAIRSLAQLGDARAIEPLMQLFAPYRASSVNVLLESTAALTTLKATKQAKHLLESVREKLGRWQYAEIETALAMTDGVAFWHATEFADGAPLEWQEIINLAKGLAAIPESDDGFERSKSRAVEWLHYAIKHEQGLKLTRAIPELLRTAARMKADGLAGILLTQLRHSDLHVRSSAASLLSLQSKDEAKLKPLIEALEKSLPDQENDAKLAILSALAKDKTEPAIAAIKTALKDRDILVRRHAVSLLKQLDAGDFSAAIGIVQTGRTAAFYQSIVAQARQKLFATITTDTGTIKLELFPQDAPLTVHNFVTLACKGYFNGLTFHRVVPNFVIQGGDPRGTGDGGPGYAIRCEINQRPYERGALGMALSGKDTGGSQWFITHAPQPHLDGGYTVFGQVVAGMPVVDGLTRDDVMRRVVITNR